MDKSKFYFLNAPDGFIYLIIMVVPFLYSFFESIQTKDYNSVRAIIIFAIITSGYSFMKISIDSQFKGYKLVLIPSYIAQFLLIASLSLSIVSISKYRSISGTLDYIALSLYLIHLGVLLFEIMRIIIESISKEDKSDPPPCPLKPGSTV